MTNDGWRSQTPELLAAEHLANQAEPLDVSKKTAMVALKRVASHIKLRSQEVMLLDTLCAFSKNQDWEPGHRPVVWASNTYLIEQTGFSLSGLRRHLRTLVKKGIIWIKDSPSGRRFGKRNEDGYIVEAFGFDLGPLAARANEFSDLYEHIKAERELFKSIRMSITIHRRSIWSMIEKARQLRLHGPWQALKSEYDDLISEFAKRHKTSDALYAILDCFVDLKARVEKDYTYAFPQDYFERDHETNSSQTSPSTYEMAPSDANFDTPKLSTNQLESLNSKSNGLGKDDREISVEIESLGAGFKNNIADKDAFEPQDELFDVNRDADLEVKGLNINWGVWPESQMRTDVDIPTIMFSCLHFSQMVRDMNSSVRNWDDLFRVSSSLRPMIGISEDAWNAAQRVLGRHIASAALALIFDKYSDQEIKSPGGYLRGMLIKAQEGELYLAKSFYGRLKRVDAS